MPSLRSPIVFPLSAAPSASFLFHPLVFECLIWLLFRSVLLSQLAFTSPSVSVPLPVCHPLPGYLSWSALSFLPFGSLYTPFPRRAMQSAVGDLLPLPLARPARCLGACVARTLHSIPLALMRHFCSAAMDGRFPSLFHPARLAFFSPF